MEEYTSTPYPKLVRAPLKLRGVFGIAFQLYKRGFFQMFLLTLLLIGLAGMLISALPLYMLSNMGVTDFFENGITQFGQLSKEFDPGRMLGAIMGGGALSMLLSLIYAFLLSPAYLGAAFMEMNERAEGRCGSFSQLLRYAVPIGFKRFYTTYLSLFLVYLGGQIVVSLIFGLIGGVFAVAAIISASSNLNIVAFIVMGIILALLLIVAITVLVVFISLVYPVAAHEGKLAFNAVKRAFTLASKNFFRCFSANLLFTLLSIFVMALFISPLFLFGDILNNSLLLAILSGLSGTLLTPYAAAFYTALYIDIASRENTPIGAV